MSKWKEFRLADVAVVNKRSVNNEFSYNDIEYIDTSSVTENKFENPVFMKFDDAPSRARRLIKSGDTILSTVRPIQRHYGFIRDPKPNTVVSTGFAVISPNGIDPKFLYYFLTQEEITEYLNTIAESGTTTFPAFRAEELNSLSIYAPEKISDQTAIAEILSSLDDKIELNNQINKELEALAQALFKHWFIDFEFPNEKGKPYKSSGGKMVESELGEVPSDWTVRTLQDDFDINMGQSPNGTTYNETGSGMIFFQGRSDFGFRFPSIRMYTTDPKKIARTGETLISVRAPVGDVNMALQDCCIGRGVGSISSKQKLMSYTYYKILSLQPELKKFDNEGTVFGSINKDTLGSISISIPTKKVKAHFNEIVVEVDKLIRESVLENESLRALRDALLPKLITGKLQVKIS